MLLNDCGSFIDMDNIMREHMIKLTNNHNNIITWRKFVKYCSADGIDMTYDVLDNWRLDVVYQFGTEKYRYGYSHLINEDGIVFPPFDAKFYQSYRKQMADRGEQDHYIIDAYLKTPHGGRIDMTELAYQYDGPFHDFNETIGGQVFAKWFYQGYDKQSTLHMTFNDLTEVVYGYDDIC